jgi:anti-sigma factor RsiW
MNGITCRQLIEFLDDYVADEQPAEVRAIFEAHLAICSHCVDYLKTYRETIALSRRAYHKNEEEVLKNAPEALVQAVLKATRGS